MTATGNDHRVTPAELFFDLVFVYALTQVTALMAAGPSPLRVVGAMVVLALLWWCWCCFTWLGNVVRADSGAMFTVLVAVMAVVLIVSLTVRPDIFAARSEGLPTALLFVLCYGAVRLLHLVSYWVSGSGDAALRRTLRRTALLSVAPPLALLLAGTAFSDFWQIMLWLGAVVVDYLGVYVTGSSGWRVNSPGHFAERYGLIVIIALGESIVAMGGGLAGFPITPPVLAATAAGLLVSAGLWRLYFRQVVEVAEHRLRALDGDDRTRFARDTYTFLHLPLVAGVVLMALGMKKVLHQVADSDHYGLAEPLHGLVAWALTGGAGLFLVTTAAILARAGGRWSAPLLSGGAACLLGGAVIALVPALVALGLLSAVITGLVVLHGRSVAALTAEPAAVSEA
ncbi:low temperature requirement protein A [Streptomyces sp. NPDC002952]|uniref:low temperature requirement protein A n=1 Tax=Streptomyces sp. NPDC002952 TaxID=3364673 RepID=UPI003695847C